MEYQEFVNENFRIARNKIQSLLGIKLQFGELVAEDTNHLCIYKNLNFLPLK